MQGVARQLMSIRRRWPMVVGLIALGTAVAVLVAVAQGSTWKATTTLVVGPRASGTPDAEAALAVGYVNLLEGRISQRQLRDTARIPEDVDLDARAVAASPLINVTATAGDSALATRSANAFADTFENRLTGTYGKIVGATRGPLLIALDGLKSALATARSNRQTARVRDLNSRLADVRRRLRAIPRGEASAVAVLTPATKPSHETPAILRNGIVGALGGAILGLGLALFLGAGEGELGGARRVRSELGLPVLARLHANTEADLAVAAERNLASVGGFLAPPASVGVTSCERDRLKSVVARGLAHAWATHGARVALVKGDPWMLEAEGAGHGNGDGVVHAIGEGRLQVVAANSPTRSAADLVVVDAPPLLPGATVAPPQLAEADAAIVVVDALHTRAADAVAARDLLFGLGRTVLGVVLVEYRA